MAIIENGKVYRNLQEQVFENTKDIEELQQNTSTEATRNLINQTYGIQDQDGATVIKRQFIVNSPIPGTEIVPLVAISGITYIGGDLELEKTLHCRNGKIKSSNHLINLPTKPGTLALLEDLPANTGILRIGNTEITEEQLQKLLQLIQV